MANSQTVTWLDLSYTVNVKKTGKKLTVLDEQYGVAEPGSMTCIMGPSGSGKTTLLDLVAGRLKSSSGERTGIVQFNGQKLSLSKRRHVLSYVQQEESLLGSFTARETLWFAARFHFGYNKISQNEIQDTVETLIAEMGLLNCADTIVGDIFRKGLSGGQRRRLSIAIELLSSPPVILLDEPTSGLDSASALGIMGVLKKLAKKQHRTVILTIHSPSSELYHQFDQFILLTKGRMVYSGKADQATDYFESCGYSCPAKYNPADYFLSLVNEDFRNVQQTEDGAGSERESLVDKERLPETADVDKLIKQFEESSLMEDLKRRSKKFLDKNYPNQAAVSSADSSADATASRLNPADTTTECVLDGEDNANEAPPPVDDIENASAAKVQIKSPKIASHLDLFVTLCYRNALNNVRNPGVFWVRFVMYTALSLMIGLMYLDLGDDFSQSSIQSRVSVFFYVAAFLVFMSVAVIPFLIMERSVFLRERVNGAYSVVHYALSTWLMAIPGIAIISVVATICVVLPSGLLGFGTYFHALFVSLVIAESIMFFVSALVPHYIIGIAGAAGLFGFFMLCQGFFIVRQDIPDWFIWGYYIGFHTYNFRVFMVNEFSRIDSFDVGPNGGFPDGQAVLDFYGMSGIWDNNARDFGILWAWAFMMFFAWILVLQFKQTGKR